MGFPTIPETGKRVVQCCEIGGDGEMGCVEVGNKENYENKSAGLWNSAPFRRRESGGSLL